MTRKSPLKENLNALRNHLTEPLQFSSEKITNGFEHSQRNGSNRKATAVSKVPLRPSQRVSNLFQTFAEGGRVSSALPLTKPIDVETTDRTVSSSLPTTEHEERRKSQSNSTTTTTTINDNRKLLTKSSKDLQRQTSTLANVELLFNNEINSSLKQIDEIFKEIRDIVKEREVELYLEMDRVKAEGLKLIHRRQHRAVELRQQLDRCDRLEANEIEKLRSDIKQFVTDRRYDFGEELRTSHRFEFDRKFVETLKTFGQVSSMNRNRRISSNSVEN